MDRLAKFVEFIEACPQGGTNFSSRYGYYLEHGELPEDCANRRINRRKPKKQEISESIS
jgi:hypothetical protein